MTGGEDELHQLNLNLHPNEASGLLLIENETLLEAHGWEFGFWVVLDEGEVQDCTAAIGHRNGAPINERWEIERLRAEPKFVVHEGKAEDAEAVTRNNGWVYIFGSHFGSKDGPLEPKRGFVARFREEEVERVGEDPAATLEIYRDSFRMHRLINDALKDSGPELVPLGSKSYEALIERTIELGAEKKWNGLVHKDDYPLNFEGAAFREDGSLLLGLRFPTSSEGYPILIELEGIERLFEPGDEMPEVRGFWVVRAVGREGTMAGVRDLAAVGDEVHLVTGNVDSRKGGSVLIQDYSEGSSTVATHFRCTLPPARLSGIVKADFVREFPTLPRVEGISISGDRFFYVTDEDEGVHLRLTRLLRA